MGIRSYLTRTALWALTGRKWTDVEARSAIRVVSGLSLRQTELGLLMAGGAQTASGELVSEETAMTYATVHACVRVLSETTGCVPLKVFERKSGGRRREADDHPAWSLLHDAPNDETTSVTFRETLQQDLCLWGNGYAEKEKTRTGRVVGLHYLPAARVRPRRTPGGALVYDYHGDGRTTTLAADDVFHVKNLGDGQMGHSPVTLARESIGLATGAQRYGAEIFGNSGTPTGVLKFPEVVDGAKHELLRDQWRKNAQRGARHGMLILDGGGEFQQTSIPPEDAQFLETRRFQREEICGIYRVPPHLIQEHQHSTYSNVRELGTSFFVFAMLPWFARWEATLNASFFAGTPFYAKFCLDGILRGDIEKRYSAYAIGRQWGFLSANDIRRLEDMDPIDGGDVYLVPLNMHDAEEDEEEQEEQETTTKGAKVHEEEEGEEGEEQRNETEQRSLHHQETRRGFETAIAAAFGRFSKRQQNALPAGAKKRIATRSAWSEWLVGWFATQAGHASAELRSIARGYCEARGVGSDDSVEEWLEAACRGSAESAALERRSAIEPITGLGELEHACRGDEATERRWAAELLDRLDEIIVEHQLAGV